MTSVVMKPPSTLDQASDPRLKLTAIGNWTGGIVPKERLEKLRVPRGD
jgi:hypothetical protein